MLGQHFQNLTVVDSSKQHSKDVMSCDVMMSHCGSKCQHESSAKSRTLFQMQSSAMHLRMNTQVLQAAGSECNRRACGC